MQSHTNSQRVKILFKKNLYLDLHNRLKIELFE